MAFRIQHSVCVTTLFTVLACEGGSVGDEGSSSSGADTSGGESMTSTTMTSTTMTSTTMTSNSTDPDTSGSSDPTDTDGTTGAGGCPQDVDFGTLDTSGCAPLSSDFTPGADDDYGACMADDNEWHLIETAPSSAARTEAYEDIIALLRNGTTPAAADFTAARALYATDNGIESRVLRRDDLHYPPIPVEDQDMSVAFDRQCTVGDNADTYPDRCVGPAKIQPIVDAAFDAGELGEGNLDVHAARIDAALQWFFFVSVYKESASCIAAPGDCDSHWAYYNGGVTHEDAIGIGLNFRDIDPQIDDAVWNGMLAINCWRDIYPPDGDPEFSDLGLDAQTMFYNAHEQLDNAMWHGWARLVRTYLEAQPAVCDAAAEANWAWVQIAGPVLDDEAELRDATAAAALASLWTNPAPSVDDLQAGVMALDALFPCPQCPECDVPQEWGY